MSEVMKDLDKDQASKIESLDDLVSKALENGALNSAEGKEIMKRLKAEKAEIKQSTKEALSNLKGWDGLKQLAQKAAIKTDSGVDKEAADKAAKEAADKAAKEAADKAAKEAADKAAKEAADKAAAETPEARRLAKDASSELLKNGYSVDGKSSYDGLKANLEKAGVKMPENYDEFLTKIGIKPEQVKDPNYKISIALDGDKLNVYAGSLKQEQAPGEWPLEQKPNKNYINKIGEIKDGVFEKSYLGQVLNDNLDNNSTRIEKGKSTYFGGNVTFNYEGGYSLDSKGNPVNGGKGKYEWSNGVTFDGKYENDTRKGKFTTMNGKMEGTILRGDFSILNSGTATINSTNGTINYELKDGKLVNNVSKDLKQGDDVKIYISKSGVLMAEKK